MLVKYEELQSDPVTVMREIAKVLECDPDLAALNSVINNSNKSAMEESFVQSSRSLARQIGDQNAAFLVPNRDEGRDIYPGRQLQRLYARYGSTMEKLGYLQDETVRGGVGR